MVASLAQDIFKELAQIEGCQGPMQMRLIPTLVSIMQAPHDKIPTGLCAVSRDTGVREASAVGAEVIPLIITLNVHQHDVMTAADVCRLLSLQTSIDILTTVVRNTKPPLSEMLVCQAFPVVAQCTLRTDDNTIMQVKSVKS